MVNALVDSGEIKIKREATCACGKLAIWLQGDPQTVLACSCLKCQKRTGSVFGVSSYFNDTQIMEVIGDSNSFEVTSGSGLKTDRRFCPNCGSTVYWKAEFLKNRIGVPVGVFSDPSFPEPSLCGWNQLKHSWVSFPDNWKSYNTQNNNK